MIVGLICLCTLVTLFNQDYDPLPYEPIHTNDWEFWGGCAWGYTQKYHPEMEPVSICESVDDSMICLPGRMMSMNRLSVLSVRGEGQA